MSASSESLRVRVTQINPPYQSWSRSYCFRSISYVVLRVSKVHMHWQMSLYEDRQKFPPPKIKYRVHNPLVQMVCWIATSRMGAKPDSRNRQPRVCITIKPYLTYRETTTYLDIKPWPILRPLTTWLRVADHWSTLQQGDYICLNFEDECPALNNDLSLGDINFNTNFDLNTISTLLCHNQTSVFSVAPAIVTAVQSQIQRDSFSFTAVTDGRIGSDDHVFRRSERCWTTFHPSFSRLLTTTLSNFTPWSVKTEIPLEVTNVNVSKYVAHSGCRPQAYGFRLRETTWVCHLVSSVGWI